MLCTETLSGSIRPACDGSRSAAIAASCMHFAGPAVPSILVSLPYAGMHAAALAVEGLLVARLPAELREQQRSIQGQANVFGCRVHEHGECCVDLFRSTSLTVLRELDVVVQRPLRRPFP